MRFLKILKQELEAWITNFIFNSPGRAGETLRYYYLKKSLKKIGERYSIMPNTRFRELKNISILDDFSIGEFSQLSAVEGSIDVGKNVGLNSNVWIGADHGEIKIGDFVSIGMNTVIRAANHRFDLSPNTPIQKQGHIASKITIGTNVWIGANTSILPGAIIGDHCVIGAGSVVSGEIPSGSLAFGTPAKVVRPLSKFFEKNDTPSGP